MSNNLESRETEDDLAKRFRTLDMARRDKSNSSSNDGHATPGSASLASTKHESCSLQDSPELKGKKLLAQFREAKRYDDQIYQFEFNPKARIDGNWDRLKLYRQKLIAARPEFHAVYTDDHLLYFLLTSLPAEWGVVVDIALAWTDRSVEDKLGLLRGKEQREKVKRCKDRIRRFRYDPKAGVDGSRERLKRYERELTAAQLERYGPAYLEGDFLHSDEHLLDAMLDGMPASFTATVDVLYSWSNRSIEDKLDLLAAKEDRIKWAREREELVRPRPANRGASKAQKTAPTRKHGGRTRGGRYL